MSADATARVRYMNPSTQPSERRATRSQQLTVKLELSPPARSLSDCSKSSSRSGNWFDCSVIKDNACQTSLYKAQRPYSESCLTVVDRRERSRLDIALHIHSACKGSQQVRDCGFIIAESRSLPSRCPPLHRTGQYRVRTCRSTRTATSRSASRSVWVGHTSHSRPGDQ